MNKTAAASAKADIEPTRIVVIRHGQTDWNAAARLQGQLDVPLNALGLRQAAALVDALRHDELVAVYASDLSRAWVTAQTLAGRLCRWPPTWACASLVLRERCLEVLEGLYTPQGFALIGWGDRAHLDALARNEPAL